MRFLDVHLERIEGADFSAHSHTRLSFDANGCLLATEVRDNVDRVSVFEIGQEGVFETRLSVSARFPHVTRFEDGRWLVVSSRSFEGEQNASVLDPTGARVLTSFEVGDAVEHAFVGQNDEIWIGHFDENPMGVRTYNADGQAGVVYSYSTGFDLFDVYAMHPSRDGVWVCAYTDFKLNRFTREAGQTILDPAPLEGCGTILVSGSHAVFIGDYDGQSLLFDLRSNTTTPIRLIADGKHIERPKSATRGDQLATLFDGGVYRTGMGQILTAAKEL